MALPATIGRSGINRQQVAATTRRFAVARPLRLALALTATLMTLAWLARISLIEPEAIAHACVANPWQGLCGPRTLLIASFSQQGLGWLALISAALSSVANVGLSAVFGTSDQTGDGTGISTTSGVMPAAIRSERALAWLAWCSGSVGLILYCYEFAAVGAIAGLLVLLKR